MIFGEVSYSQIVVKFVFGCQYWGQCQVFGFGNESGKDMVQVFVNIFIFEFVFGKVGDFKFVNGFVNGFDFPGDIVVRVIVFKCWYFMCIFGFVGKLQYMFEVEILIYYCIFSNYLIIKCGCFLFVVFGQGFIWEGYYKLVFVVF